VGVTVKLDPVEEEGLQRYVTPPEAFKVADFPIQVATDGTEITGKALTVTETFAEDVQ
jgi:hypothetical protein